MTNSLAWHPRVSELHALSALLSAGCAAFGVVLIHGGRGWPPHRVIGGVVAIFGTLAMLATLAPLVGDRRRRRRQAAAPGFDAHRATTRASSGTL